jgi:dienelactone hydrolase
MVTKWIYKLSIPELKVIKMKKIYLLILFCLFTTTSFGAMHKEEVAYQHGDTQLKGYIFWDDAFEGKRPSVMVFHEWWGLNDYALLRAEMLAESGYVAFAADMYGDSRNTRHAEDAQGWMKQITGNIDVWRERAVIAYKQLIKNENVDSSKTAAIGFCFGGATVMQLAYAGTDLGGVISVHGSLPPATPEQVKNIKARVLVLHGGSDGFVPRESVDQFIDALSDAGVDWEMDVYGGARHAFSNPYADGYGIDGIEFNEEAEKRAWARSLTFLEELFSVEDF